MANNLPNIRLRYVTALLLVGALITSSVVLVKGLLVVQQNDASIINMAGKQRMLSQKISLYIHKLIKHEQNLEFEQSAHHLRILKDATDRFERNHYELLSEFEASNDPIFERYFEGYPDLNDSVMLLVKTSRTLINNDGINNLDTTGPAFSDKLLADLDSIVSQLESDARQRVQSLMNVVVGLWFAGMILLLLEARYIFYPMERMIRQSVRILEDQITQISVLNSEKMEAEKLTAKIENQANHDDLTGLLNLKKAEEYLETHIQKANQSNQQVAVLFIDLDDFKLVNDNYGHVAGDHTLKQVAKRIQTHIREKDYACRAGGDEFLVVLNNLQDKANLHELCQRLVDSISEPIVYEGQSMTVGVSIGAAIYPDHAQDAINLKKTADSIMYRVKRSGKNSYSIAG